MSSNLDLSLGDIIASGKKNREKKSKPRVRGNGGSARNNKVARSERKEKIAPYKRDEKPIKRTIENTSKPHSNSFGKSTSILNRVGNVTPSGFPVEISNLNHDITDDEIMELCETIGKVISCNTKKDKSGKSFGKSIVHFSKQSDATDCFDKFNGCSLDGTPMKIKVLTPRDNNTTVKSDTKFSVTLNEPKSEKSTICFAFEKGECTRGDGCRFDHISSGNSRSERTERRERDDKKSTICFAFQKGDCDRGDSCRFDHVSDNNVGGDRRSRKDDTRGEKKSDVCFAFQKGECDRGDSCRFSHSSGGTFDRGRDSRPKRESRPVARKEKREARVPASSDDLDAELDSYMASKN